MKMEGRVAGRESVEGGGRGKSEEEGKSEKERREKKQQRWQIEQQQREVVGKLLKPSGMCHKKLQTYESARTAVVVSVVVVIAIVVAQSFVVLLQTKMLATFSFFAAKTGCHLN